MPSLCGTQVPGPCGTQAQGTQACKGPRPVGPGPFRIHIFVQGGTPPFQNVCTGHSYMLSKQPSKVPKQQKLPKLPKLQKLPKQPRPSKQPELQKQPKLPKQPRLPSQPSASAGRATVCEPKRRRPGSGLVTIHRVAKQPCPTHETQGTFVRETWAEAPQYIGAVRR